MLKRSTLLLTSLCLLHFSGTVNASAANIAFNNDVDTKWIPFLSYQALFESLHALSKAEPLILQSMRSSTSIKEQQALNAKFQTEKSKAAVFREPLPLFKLFSNLLITIHTNNQALAFHLPKQADITEFRLDKLSIASTEATQQTIKGLLLAKEKMNSLLPKGNDANSLGKFQQADKISEKYDSEFSVTNQAEANALLNELIAKNKKFNHELDNLLALAQQKNQQQFKLAANKLTKELQSSMIASLSLFTGNTLKLTSDGETKIYQFYPLSLEKFGLEHNDISTKQHAEAALKNIANVFKWVNNWIFNGSDNVAMGVKINTPDVAGQYHSKEYLAQSKELNQKYS